MNRISVVQSLISSEVAVPLDSADVLGLLRDLGWSASFHDLNHGDELPERSELVYLSTYTVVPYRAYSDFPLILRSVRELQKRGNENIIVGSYWLREKEIQELTSLGVKKVISGDTVSGLGRYFANRQVEALKVSPDFSHIPVGRYRKSFFSQGRTSLPVVFSRGCDLDCTYCPVENSLRRMSMDEIQMRIEYLIRNYGVNHLMIEDDLFNSSPEFVEEFCDLLDHFPRLTWECLNGIHPELMGPSTWRRLGRSNCVHVAVGLECLDRDSLVSRGRSYDIPAALRGMSVLRDSGKAVSGYFLFDLLLDSPGGLARQLTIMKETPVSSFHFSSLRRLTVAEKILRSISLVYLHFSPGRICHLRKLGYISGNSLVRSVNKIIGADA